MTKSPIRQSFLQDVHLRPPTNPNFHQLPRARHALTSQLRFPPRSALSRSINSHSPNICNVEDILGDGIDHVKKDDACSVCDAIWKFKGGIIVSIKVYESVGVKSG